MSVYKSAKSPFYQYDFQVQRRRFFGSTEATNKKEAEGIERQLKAKAREDLAQEKRSGNGPMTLDVAAGRYTMEVMQGKPSEGDTFLALQRLMKIIGGDTLMSDVSDHHVSLYIASRRKDTRWGRKVMKDDTPMAKVANATINREVAVLKRLFFRARKTWKITLPNEPDWRGHRLKEVVDEDREFTVDQTETLYAAIREDYLPWFEFAHNSGLRLNETILRWTSVNFKTGEIRTKGKGDKWVSTQITPTIRAILQPLIGHHPEYVFTYVAARTHKPTGKVRGQRYPITYSGIQSLWARLKKDDGLIGLRIHDIRHDAASKIVRATGNLKIAQKLLNHSSIAVTSRYAAVMDTEVADAMEMVAKSRNISRKGNKNVA